MKGAHGRNDYSFSKVFFFVFSSALLVYKILLWGNTRTPLAYLCMIEPTSLPKYEQLSLLKVQSTHSHPSAEKQR